MSRSNDLMKPLEFSSFYMEPGKSSDTSDYRGEKHRMTWRLLRRKYLSELRRKSELFDTTPDIPPEKAHILPPASPVKRSLDLKHSQKFVACRGQLIIKSHSKRASKAAQTSSDEVPTKFRRHSPTVYAFAPGTPAEHVRSLCSPSIGSPPGGWPWCIAHTGSQPGARRQLPRHQFAAPAA